VGSRRIGGQHHIRVEGSEWYKRFVDYCKSISPHIYIKPIKQGFSRIYWRSGGRKLYIHEVYRWMPLIGYDVFDKDEGFESHRYFEEFEDSAELTLNIKNFVEGYWDSKSTIDKRVYMFRNNKEYNEEQEQLSKQIVVH
jgi:hypothetical protein